MIDFFGYKDIEKWPGNPEVLPINFRDGAYVLSGVSCCEDTMILLAEEAKYRRSCSSLTDYFKTWPPVSGLASDAISIDSCTW